MNLRLMSRTPTRLACLALAVLAVTGCGHRRNVAMAPAPQALPPAPGVYSTEAPPAYAPNARPLGRIPVTPLPPGGVSPADLEYVATHRPILRQFGVASWYTAPYRGRKAANGEVFDDSAMTAAHRTLPMGSLIVVTNLDTGKSSAMRVADRGPFVQGRIVDLTIASAKAIGAYRRGLARVRLDVYEAPKPITTGGRWCVQIGAFSSKELALRFKERLIQRYPHASVIEFSGERSYWVRIRPEGDNRAMADYLAHHLHPPQGESYLTRLD